MFKKDFEGGVTCPSALLALLSYKEDEEQTILDHIQWKYVTTGEIYKTMS